MAVTTDALRTHALTAPRSADQDGAQSEQWALLSLHRDRVVRLMCARGVSPEDAEDSVHDAMIQLAAHPSLDGSRAGALLSVVAMRRAYDRRRGRIREARALRRIGGFADVAVSPVDAALDRVEAAWLARHVERLPLRQRDVLGRHARGLTVMEAAESLGVTAKAAESALSRARVALRATVAAATALSLALMRRARLASSGGSVSLAAATLTAGLMTGALAAAGHDASVHDGAPASMRIVSVSDSARRNASVRAWGMRPGGVVPPAARIAGHAGGVPALPVPPFLVQLTGVGSHSTVANDGVSVQRSDGNESFTESLEHCVTDGVSLDTSRLGCPPR